MSHTKNKSKSISEKEEKLILDYLNDLQVGEVVCTKELYELLRGKTINYNDMLFQRNANLIIGADKRFQKRFLITEEYGKQRCWLKTTA